MRECDYRSTCEAVMYPRADQTLVSTPAEYFAQFGGIVDPEYTAETGNKYYGWWGFVCKTCLEEIKKLVEEHKGALRFLPAEKVKPIPIKGSVWHEYRPNWSEATVIGNPELLPKV